MNNIKSYWENKTERAKKALEHAKEMEIKYHDQILYSIENTFIFSNNAPNTSTFHDYKRVILEDIDSVSAIFKYSEGRTAVLNFSSYKNPGGQFIKGSKAQEECLCHESFLYNVQKGFQSSFYDWNNRHKNRALYLNRLMYSHDIIFEHDENIQKADVITCAAPNKFAAQKYQNISDEENLAVLKSRIEFIMKTVATKNINTLILGAYGCGVFGQDPREVATIFRNCLESGYSGGEKIVFAIPNRNKNLRGFIDVFKGLDKLELKMK